jgi:outer membrane protein
MKNIQNIVIGILAVAVCVLFFLQFKGSSTNVMVNPTSKDIASLGGGKVAFINTDSFFAHYTKYKNLEKEVKESNEQAQASLQSRMKSLEAEYMQLVQGAQSGKITPQQAQAKEQDLVRRKQALEAEGQGLMKNIAEKGSKASDELYKTLKDYFDKNKGKYHCDYVLGYQKEGVALYIDPRLDITNQVVEDLNKLND